VAFSTDYPRHTERPGRIIEQAVWCATPDDNGIGDFDQLVKAQQYDDAHCPASGGEGGNGSGGSSAGMGRYHLTAIGSVLAVAGLIAALVYWAWHKKHKRNHRWTNVPTSSPVKTTTRSILRDDDGNGRRGSSGDKHRHVMVRPEGKTYRETELHVIVERTEGSTNNHYKSTTNYHHQRTQPLTSDL